jgi:hypothetical protein
MSRASLLKRLEALEERLSAVLAARASSELQAMSEEELAGLEAWLRAGAPGGDWRAWVAEQRPVPAKEPVLPNAERPSPDRDGPSAAPEPTPAVAVKKKPPKKRRSTDPPEPRPPGYGPAWVTMRKAEKPPPGQPRLW